MPRLQLFEFTDLNHAPQLWRDMMTEQLIFVSKYGNPYGKIAPKLKEVLEKLNCHNIIDLCAGAGGPTVELQRQLEFEENYPVTITLTDKFPYEIGFEKASIESNRKVTWSDMSVDAMNVPKSLKGFRTLFTAFHHFDVDSATKILEDAVRNKEGIGIFEMTDRESFATWIAIFSGPFISFLVVPHYKPFSWKKIFLTYIFPIYPLIAFWEGVASNLRTYTPKELRQMINNIDHDDFNWEIGKIGSANYLIGYPKEPD